MRSSAVIISCALAIAIGLGLIYVSRFTLLKPDGSAAANDGSHVITISTSTSTMKLASSAFEDNGAIPSAYTCDGRNVNPPLEIFNVPQAAASLALIVDDPDAPNGTWDHWIVFNMSPDVTAVAEGVQPQGTPGRGSQGLRTYQGPCPPSGTHHYVFTIYALDQSLAVPAGATKDEVLRAMKGHILDQTQLVGTYQKK